MRSIVGIACALALSLSLTSSAGVTYTYDGLGRLTKATPDSGNAVCYSYDPADNRTTVSAGCGGGGEDSPPTANNDIVYLGTGVGFATSNLSVLSNDTDPDLPGDTLTVTGVSGTYFSVVSGGSDVNFAGPVGDFVGTYTISDSHGATSSATVTVHVYATCAPLDPLC